MTVPTESEGGPQQIYSLLPSPAFVFCHTVTTHFTPKWVLTPMIHYIDVSSSWHPHNSHFPALLSVSCPHISGLLFLTPWDVADRLTINSLMLDLPKNISNWLSPLKDNFTGYRIPTSSLQYFEDGTQPTHHCTSWGKFPLDLITQASQPHPFLPLPGCPKLSSLIFSNSTVMFLGRGFFFA